MKLSDIRGEKTIDVIADLIPPIARMANDPEVRNLFKRDKVPKGMEPVEFFAERMENAAPKLLKAHRDDVILILATMADKSVKEYVDALSPLSLLNNLLQLLNDDSINDFF